jgi:hypothetical protein
MKRSVVGTLGAAVIATLGVSSASQAVTVDFSFTNLGGSVTHDGSSLDMSSQLDFDDALFFVTEAGTGGDASGLIPGDFINLSADTQPVSKDVLYGFGDKLSDFPTPLEANLILSWPMVPAIGADVFTETLTTVTSINRMTPDAITVTMTGTVSDKENLFKAATPVQLIMSASQAGGGSDITGVEFTNTSSLTPSIPEPSTWVMMTLGFGALGCAAFRRRKANLAVLPA